MKVNKLFLYGGLLFISKNLCAEEKISTTSRPNVIIILADDQKWNTIGALGNPEIKTPNLDKLVENSLVFRNAYCFGGNCGAVSIPSRNQLITGRNWFSFERDLNEQKKKNRKYRRPVFFANKEWDNIPKTFKKNGYDTFYREKNGKSNLHEIREQFDNYADISLIESLKTGRAARKMVDDAIDYMSNREDKSKPFMMYLGLPCPHDPRWSLEDFYNLYDDEDISLPKNFLPNHTWDIGSMTIRDEKLSPFPRTPEIIKRHLHDYYGLISAMDYDLGRLFAYLEDEKLFDNTIIVYSADQGIAIGDHGLMGKQNLYEGTMKVPFFITGPGVKKGQTDAFVYLHDIYPTLCSMVGIDIPEGLDGVSFKEVVENKSKTGKRDNVVLAYSAQKRNQRSIRIGDWKFIWYPEIDKCALYDLKKDPYEITNLAYEGKYKDKVDQMLASLKKELKIIGDVSDLKKDDTINPIFQLPDLKVKHKWGIAPGPDFAAPPVEKTDGYPLFMK